MSDSTQESRRAEQQAHFTQAHIDIAVLKAEMASMAREHARVNSEMAESVKAMGREVAAMNALLSEAKGGWKVIAAVAGVAGVAGSALSWFIAHMGVFRA